MLAITRLEGKSLADPYGSSSRLSNNTRCISVNLQPLGKNQHEKANS